MGSSEKAGGGGLWSDVSSESFTEQQDDHETFFGEEVVWIGCADLTDCCSFCLLYFACSTSPPPTLFVQWFFPVGGNICASSGWSDKLLQEHGAKKIPVDKVDWMCASSKSPWLLFWKMKNICTVYRFFFLICVMVMTRCLAKIWYTKIQHSSKFTTDIFS